MGFGLNMEHDGVEFLLEHVGKFKNEVDFEKGLHVSIKGRRRRAGPLGAPRCQNQSKKGTAVPFGAAVHQNELSRTGLGGPIWLRKTWMKCEIQNER